MFSVKGVYENGEIKFKEKVPVTGNTQVIVTFLEDNGDEEIYYPGQSNAGEEKDFIGRLMANPLTVESFKPFTREEIYGR